MKLVIIDYGVGNIKSIQFAFKRIGIEAILSKDRKIIQSADKLIFPGVGDASFAMKKLKENKLVQIIPELKQPVLGIWLGMQLMCNHTEEGNTECLGIFNTNVKRFNTNVKVPQMGWNTINNLKSKVFKEINSNSHMYLVHSYFVEKSKETIATTDYQLEYSAAMKKNNFYGVQFHPEKSGINGEQLLKNFINL